MTAASRVKFQFERGRGYSLGSVRAFEAELLAARQSDCALSEELRAPGNDSPRWIKLRNEELVPMIYYARHKGIADHANYIIMPEGCKVDIQLNASDYVQNFQVTVADPQWGFPDAGSIKHGGHERRLSMELLNRDGSDRWGPIVKSKENLTRDGQMVSTPQAEEAHHAGLKEAMVNKFRKNYCEGDVSLLVHARAYCDGLSIQQFREIARRAYQEAKSEANGNHTFVSVCVLDREDGYFIDLPN